jgi:CHAT domain-containing protein
VSDVATALLMAKFYDLHMGSGLSPPAALSKAQAWLRQATTDDLSAYTQVAAAQGRLLSRHRAEIEAALSATGSARSPNPTAADPTEPVRHFAHPYYWAGFIHTGL